jgi:OmpA-OmpF porin, OOP family
VSSTDLIPAYNNHEGRISMSNGNKLALSTACILCVVPMVHAEDLAHAEDAGWYVGAGIGQSQADVPESPFFRKDDDWADTWSLTGGYRFNSWFALEVGYLSLGTVNFHSDTSVPGVFDVDASAKAEGFNTALVGSLPLGSAFDLHGRFGLLFSETDLDIHFPDGSRQSSSDSNQDVFYGVGVGWRVNEKWSLSLDYQHYTDVGSDESVGEADIDTVGVSAFFRF